MAILRFNRFHGTSGAGLVELLLVLPVLIIVGVAMVNIGRVVLQAQVLSDAAKIGARAAVRQSGLQPEASCNVLAAVGAAAARDYRDNADKWGLKSQWGKICAEFSPVGAWDFPDTWVPPNTNNHMRLRNVTIYFKLSDETQNCLFCSGTFLRLVKANPRATFDLAQGTVAEIGGTGCALNGVGNNCFEF